MSKHSLHAFSVFLPIYILMARLVQVTYSAEQGTDLQLFALSAALKVCRTVQGNCARRMEPLND